MQYSLGYADPPPFVDFLLTDACNLRCSYCPIWGEEAPSIQPFLADTDKFLRLVDDISAFRPMIRFFGGEALLHPDWPAIVARAQTHGIFCTAVSNGVRLAQQTDQLISSGLLAIGISLDGDPAGNDEARGAGTYRQIVDGIHTLAREKRRRGSPTPQIEIYTTVTPGNYRHLVAWAEELATWEIELLRLQHLIWFSPAQLTEAMAEISGVIENPALVRQEEKSYSRAEPYDFDPEIMIDRLARLRRLEVPFRIEEHPHIALDELEEFLTVPEYTRRIDRTCRTLEQCSFVDPAGMLYPCMSLDMGNVFERPFLEVWNGPRFRAFRRLVRRHGRLPVCHRCPDASGDWDPKRGAGEGS